MDMSKPQHRCVGWEFVLALPPVVSSHFLSPVSALPYLFAMRDIFCVLGICPSDRRCHFQGVVVLWCLSAGVL